MVAVDTNVLVRLLTCDDPAQAAAARSVFQSERIWITKTVLLETAWVLRRVYKFNQQAILDAFMNLFGLENVQIEDEASMSEALALSGQAIELADAIHLSSRPRDVPFLSFDGAFVQRANLAGVMDASVPRVRR